MKINKRIGILFVMTALLALALGGCMRKHVVSSPPAQRPAKEVEPAPKPAVVEEKPEVLQDTYIVDAPVEEGAPAAKVQEGDLADEPVAAPVEAIKPEVAPEAAPEAAVIADEAAKSDAMNVVNTAETQPAIAPMGEMYFVQVGAFSDLENANAVLARLLSDGYKGSKLSKTADGLFRVQAGAFSDQASAEAVMQALKSEFPKGFVLKGVPEE